MSKDAVVPKVRPEREPLRIFAKQSQIKKAHEISDESASGPDYKRGGFYGTKPIGKGAPNSAGYCHGAGWGRRIFYGTKPNLGGTFNSAVNLPVDQMTSEVVFLRNEANPQRRSEFGRRVASGAE